VIEVGECIAAEQLAEATAYPFSSVLTWWFAA
jgi:hypothetical protein